MAQIIFFDGGTVKADLIMTDIVRQMESSKEMKFYL